MLVQLSAVNNDIPVEAEIEIVVQGMKGGIEGGPSGMRADNLKGWRKNANREKDTEGRRWELVVIIVQVMCSISCIFKLLQVAP